MSNTVMDAVKAFLETQEIIETPEEARLLLAFDEYEGGKFITGKDGCDCKDDCDECWTREQKIDWLTKLANK